MFTIPTKDAKQAESALSKDLNNFFASNSTAKVAPAKKDEKKESNPKDMRE